MGDYFIRPEERTRFDAGKAVKLDLFQGGKMMVGMNCFEPGQEQKVHSHGEADKFYYVLSGRARIVAGEESAVVSAGALVLAPAGVPHGVTEVLERTVLLVGIAGR